MTPVTANGKTPAPPVVDDVVEIFAGIGCPNRCRFCSDEAERGQAARLAVRSKDDLLARLAVVPASAAIRFTGFEPTTNPALADLIRAAKVRGHKPVSLATNGFTLGDPVYLDRLIQAGLDAVDISIHGDRPELHDALVQRAGAFAEAERALQVMRDARARGLEFALNIKAVMVRQNLPRLLEIVRFFDSFSPDTIVLLAVKAAGGAANDPQTLLPDFTELKAALESLSRSEVCAPLGVVHVPLCIAIDLDAGMFGFSNRVQVAEEAGLSQSVNTNEGAAFAEICAACEARALCTGVPNAALALYGDEALKPISADMLEAFQRRVARARPRDPGEFLDAGERLALVQPLDTRRVGGWSLADHEADRHLVRYRFSHLDGRELGLVLMPRNAAEVDDTTARFALIYDGQSMPASVRKFWETLVRLIRANDREK